MIIKQPIGSLYKLVVYVSWRLLTPDRQRDGSWLIDQILMSLVKGPY